MNIEKYGFDRPDLIIVTAVNSYLKNLTSESRKETLAGIVAFCGPQWSAMHFPAVAVRDKTVAENHPTWDSH